MRPISPTPPQIPAWQSPVPYLFGGLAAMLGVISFALLLLGCSYWKLSVQSEERDLEAANNNEKIKEEEQQQHQMRVYEEKILVIMAGDQNPTFLATPAATAAAPKAFNSFSQSNNEPMDSNVGKVEELGHSENDLPQD